MMTLCWKPPFNSTIERMHSAQTPRDRTEETRNVCNRMEYLSSLLLLLLDAARRLYMATRRYAHSSNSASKTNYSSGERRGSNMDPHF